MFIRILFPISIFLAFAIASCSPTAKPEKAPDSPDNVKTENKPDAQIQQSTALVEAPFNLFINDEKVSINKAVNVPENRSVMINFMADKSMSGEMTVKGPDGKSIILGRWQADMTSFQYAFQYGENHLFIASDKESWDFPVIAGPPRKPVSDFEGYCKTYIALNPDSRWAYDESIANDVPRKWNYHFENFTPQQNGDVHVNLVMERMVGLELNVDKTTTVYLVFSGSTIYITQVVEVEGTREAIMTYNIDTVFLPPTIKEGTNWKRIGSMKITENGKTEILSVTQTFNCIGEEKISIKAGEFTAAKVDYVLTAKGDDEDDTYNWESWYVPGLGQVLSDGANENSPRLELIKFENVVPGI